MLYTLLWPGAKQQPAVLVQNRKITTNYTHLYADRPLLHRPDICTTELSLVRAQCRHCNVLCMGSSPLEQFCFFSKVLVNNMILIIVVVKTSLLIDKSALLFSYCHNKDAI